MKNELVRSPINHTYVIGKVGADVGLSNWAFQPSPNLSNRGAEIFPSNLQTKVSTDSPDWITMGRSGTMERIVPCKSKVVGSASMHPSHCVATLDKLLASHCFTPPIRSQKNDSWLKIQ